jgi:endogenous inhibitor of DNA gyrase (YacG/DUF329 family)
MYSKENTRIENDYRIFKGLTNEGTCIICGDPFKSRSALAKYCSQRCKNDRQIKIRKDKSNKKREAIKGCIVCKAEITQKETDKIKKYCSSKCKQIAYRNRKKALNYETPTSAGKA